MRSNLAVLRRDWRYPVREERSSLENPQTPLSYPAEWLLDIFNGGRTDAGIRVSELTAFQVGTFLSCVDLIAGTTAAQPVHIYERQINQHGRAIHRIAYEHNYYDLVTVEPNEEMTWRTFLYALLCHALAWPGAYAEIQRDSGNAVVAFWPRNPAKTRPRRLTQAMHLDPVAWRPFPVDIPSGRMVFETTDGIEDGYDKGLQTGGSQPHRIIPSEDMLHIPGLLALDGRIGQGVVWLARNALGLALAAEKFGSKYFANFAKPGGLLEMPAKITDADMEISKRSWQEAQGGENAHRVAVMPPGFKFTPISNNAQESQTVELMTYIRTIIASNFHVPPRMVGDTSTKTRGSSEQENQELLDFALMPAIVAIRQEFKRKVFPHRGIGRTPRNPYFLNFDMSALIRGDAASREKFNASGKQWGILNTNDARALEGMNPIDEEWAEQYWMPVNMTLPTTPVDPTKQDGAGASGAPFGRGLRMIETRDGWVTINGTHIFIGHDAGKLTGKQQLAIASHKGGGRAAQDAAEKSEMKVAKALGIPRTKDNSPFDLRNDDVGIEVKTMVEGTNDKVTMSKAALGRKLAEAQAEGLKTFTVVADARKGTTKYYVSSKLGSIRLGSMTPATLAEIKDVVRP
jgi:HK97 family phage portal protein